MDFSQPKPKREHEPALPMINVVFLLLIFFLMSAQIMAPPPLEVSPPVAEQGSAPADDLRLHLSMDGTLALDDLRDAAVWEMLAETTDPDKAKVLIRADAALPAAELAKVLTRLSALGFQAVQLATERK